MRQAPGRRCASRCGSGGEEMPHPQNGPFPDAGRPVSGGLQSGGPGKPKVFINISINLCTLIV